MKQYNVKRGIAAILPQSSVMHCVGQLVSAWLQGTYVGICVGCRQGRHPALQSLPLERQITWRLLLMAWLASKDRPQLLQGTSLTASPNLCNNAFWEVL